MTIDDIGTPLNFNHYSTVGGDGGCRVGEVRATSYFNFFRDTPIPFLSEFSEILHFKG